MSALGYLLRCREERMGYPERAAVAREKGLVFSVVVPVNEDTYGIKKGSGIVTIDAGVPEGFSLLYFEGDIYRTDPRPFEDLLMHAADRMATAYPTVAQAVVPSDGVKEIGLWSYAQNHFICTDEAALNAWRG